MFVYSETLELFKFHFKLIILYALFAYIKTLIRIKQFNILMITPMIIRTYACNENFLFARYIFSA